MEQKKGNNVTEDKVKIKENGREGRGNGRETEREGRKERIQAMSETRMKKKRK